MVMLPLRSTTEAMMAGEGGVVSGWQNKLQVAVAAAHVMPEETLARQHTKMAASGTAKKKARK
jgi:uncharacterized protein